jgi:peroxiredoxin
MELPPDLPVPVDDGAADHLPGSRMPSVRLPSTGGRLVDVGGLPPHEIWRFRGDPGLGPGRTVLYCYPRTGRPDRPVPDGWDAIPGARGCTPESCGFRDHAGELADLGAIVFGVSTQSTEDQREVAERLRLPFELLSDARLDLASALRLPTFQFESSTLLKRLTLVVHNGAIEHVFYPVFPPDRHAEEVVRWLSRSE